MTSSSLRRSFSTSFLDDATTTNGTTTTAAAAEAKTPQSSSPPLSSSSPSSSARNDFIALADDVYDRIRQLNGEVLTFDAASRWVDDRVQRMKHVEWTLTPKGSPFTWLLTADEAAECAVMALSTDQTNREVFLQNLVMWKKQPWEDALNRHVDAMMAQVCEHVFVDTAPSSKAERTVLGDIATLQLLPDILSDISIKTVTAEASRIVTRTINGGGSGGAESMSSKWTTVLRDHIVVRVRRLIDDVADGVVRHVNPPTIDWHVRYAHWPVHWFADLDFRQLTDAARDLCHNKNARRMFLVSRRAAVTSTSPVSVNVDRMWFDAFTRILAAFVDSVCACLCRDDRFDPESVFSEMHASLLAERLPTLWNEYGDINPVEVVGDGGFLLVCHAQALANTERKRGAKQVRVERYIGTELASHPARQAVWRRGCCRCAPEWVEYLAASKSFAVRRTAFVCDEVTEMMWKSRCLLYVYTHRVSGWSYVGRVGQNSTLVRTLSQHVLAAFGLVDGLADHSPLYPCIRLSNPDDWSVSILRSVIPPKCSLTALQCFWIGQLNTAYPRGLNHAFDRAPERDPACSDPLVAAHVDAVAAMMSLCWRHDAALNAERDNQLLQRSIVYLVDSIRGLCDAILAFEKQQLVAPSSSSSK